MIHAMGLRPGPFAAVASRRKTVELRLYDKKRARIAVGDVIVFSAADTGRTVRARVAGLERFPSFEELYRHFSPSELGYLPGEAASPADMLQYYSPDEIARYGVVGIIIEAEL